MAVFFPRQDRYVRARGSILVQYHTKMLSDEENVWVPKEEGGQGATRGRLTARTVLDATARTVEQYSTTRDSILFNIPTEITSTKNFLEGNII